MKICYYLLEDIFTEEIEVFNTLKQKEYTDIYFNMKQEYLELETFNLKVSMTPFLSNQVVADEMALTGIAGLPIVTVNDKIFQKGRILTAEELSKLLGIGISIQPKD